MQDLRFRDAIILVNQRTGEQVGSVPPGSVIAIRTPEDVKNIKEDPFFLYDPIRNDVPLNVGLDCDSPLPKEVDVAKNALETKRAGFQFWVSVPAVRGLFDKLENPKYIAHLMYLAAMLPWDFSVRPQEGKSVEKIVAGLLRVDKRTAKVFIDAVCSSGYASIVRDAFVLNPHIFMSRPEPRKDTAARGNRLLRFYSEAVVSLYKRNPYALTDVGRLFSILTLTNVRNGVLCRHQFLSAQELISPLSEDDILIAAYGAPCNSGGIFDLDIHDGKRVSKAINEVDDETQEKLHYIGAYEISPKLMAHVRPGVIWSHENDRELKKALRKQRYKMRRVERYVP